MPKIKWDGANEHTINNFYKIDNKKSANACVNCIIK